MSEWWKGGSILMKEHSQWVELAGHDYVMDLISDLELPTDFPKQKSYFIISTDDPARVRAKTSLSVWQNALWKFDINVFGCSRMLNLLANCFDRWATMGSKI